MNILKALGKMSLYLTGTVMRTRLPKEMTIAKNSKTFKEMNKGIFKKHLFKYVIVDGIKNNVGWLHGKTGIL